MKPGGQPPRAADAGASRWSTGCGDRVDVAIERSAQVYASHAEEDSFPLRRAPEDGGSTRSDG
jgi:hypothetical protein